MGIAIETVRVKIGDHMGGSSPEGSEDAGVADAEAEAGVLGRATLSSWAETRRGRKGRRDDVERRMVRCVVD
jgi:hypothetical protein